MTTILRDTQPFVYSLVESGGEGKPFIVEGIFQRAGVKNANGRIYPRSVLERNLEKTKAIVAERGMWGEIDHPSDGEIKLSRTSHLVTHLEMKEDGTVIGRAEILDTPGGLILKEMFRAGGRVAISSRGNGSCVKENGADVVQEDFNLQTFDFVSNPSTSGAFPRPVMESKDESMPDTAVDTTKLFKSLRTEALQVINAKPTMLTEASQQDLAEKADELIIGLGRLAGLDPGYKPLSEEITKKLIEKQLVLVKAPALENRLAAAEAIIQELASRLSESDDEIDQSSAIEELQADLEEAHTYLVAQNRIISELRSRNDVLESLIEDNDSEEEAPVTVNEEVVKFATRQLALPSNAHLRHLAPTLQTMESVEEVKNFLAEVNKPRQVNEAANLNPTTQPASASSNNGEYITESTDRLRKRFGFTR